MKNFLLMGQKRKKNSEKVYKRTSKVLFSEAEESFIREEYEKEESAFESRFEKYIEEVENEIQGKDKTKKETKY